MNEVTLHGKLQAPARRIVSLAPSLTEILFYLGMGRSVIGVTQQCDFPESVDKIRKIGSFAKPDPECIQGLMADTIVGLRNLHQGMTKILTDKHTGLIMVNYHSVPSILDVMESIGSLAPDTDTALEKVASLRQRTGVLRQNSDNRRTVRTLLIMSDDPIIVPGRNSYQYDALEIVGAEQIPYNHTEYERTTIEQVVHFDPEVIFACGRHRNEPPPKKCPGCHAENPICQRVVEDLGVKPGWHETSASRNEQVHPLPCHWLCRPGPRLIEGMEAIAGILSVYVAKMEK